MLPAIFFNLWQWLFCIYISNQKFSLRLDFWFFHHLVCSGMYLIFCLEFARILENDMGKISITDSDCFRIFLSQTQNISITDSEYFTNFSREKVSDLALRTLHLEVQEKFYTLQSHFMLPSIVIQTKCLMLNMMFFNFNCNVILCSV